MRARWAWIALFALSLQAAADRGRGGRRNLRAAGGNGLTENAVWKGLHWLANHTDGNGGWGDPATTSRCVLAFLGAGYTDRGTPRENRYAETVKKGLRSLISRQAEDGAIGSRKDLRAHALCAAALCEGWWMTRNPRYKKPAQKALDFLVKSRTPKAGWGNTVATVWATLALRSGKVGGLNVDENVFVEVRKLLADPQATTSLKGAAGALLVRIHLGEDPRSSAALKPLADKVVRNPPGTDPNKESFDFDYWQLGTLAMFQVGGSRWKTWNETMKSAIVKSQKAKGDQDAGSWDPTGREDLSRTAATASLTATLEVYYRYDRVFGKR